MSDADLAGLVRLQSLDYLTIDSTRLSSDSLEYVAQLQELKALRLDSFKLHASSFRMIRDLKQLEVLGLRSSKLSEELIARIGAQRTAKSLDLLNASGLTSRAVRELADLRHISSLTLDGTELDDAGMKYLERMRALQCLSVVQTRVTPGALVRFKRALLDCVLYVRPNEVFQLPEKGPGFRPERDPVDLRPKPPPGRKAPSGEGR